MNWCMGCGDNKVIAKGRLLCASCIVKKAKRAKLKEAYFYLRLFVLSAVSSVVFFFIIKHFELYKY